MTQLHEQSPDRTHDERREQIKRAALKIFAQRGIAGTKMSMIASEAGISQGLSYRYFNSKEEIFSVLVQEAIEEAQAAINNVHQLPGTPLEQIRTLTKRMLDESHKHFFLLLQQVQKSDEVPAKAKEMVNQYSPRDTIDKLVPIFIKGQQTGEFCQGNPQELLILYFTVITGLMLQETQSNKGWLLEVDTLMKILTK
ncbi:AcrR family transcriptional regulator [Paenibacillus sp. V4I3]|uniref:TetR/AcrR family transcriptional regulator n=1 Tax=unclassified Paenibacillus TaxID=185978 RepID=UPI0027825D55|nr:MULTISPECIES: TetR/AcrR family transcriptional regulator [unclassified Paenibacillus]MDQ0878718.1 AcrR family transcriptional regulator [Paenibacillus sp. V4I3]MDQ0885426.1 AcrR family transcriptional regulator [Paenibacillus sp. V4I9]